MMDWTDRHCRYFHRLITRHALLYTEMVTTGALLHGDQPRHLDFNPEEHPVALQLGGSEPADLAACARLAERWGYDEVNLNCGCPSERVQKGAFGACLMAEPQLVADCVKAMRDATALPVTVKHRIGIDKIESYDFVRDFVGTVAAAGCEVFIVHARKAWLQGLSPKENRDIPPLDYDLVYRLKRERPNLTIAVNGGVPGVDAALEHLANGVDGVMLGRAAYHEAGLLGEVDRRVFGLDVADVDSFEAVERYRPYLARELAAGTHLAAMTRHMLGLFHGLPGARAWRRILTVEGVKAGAGLDVVDLALDAVRAALASREEKAAPAA